jgi:hypothetical protein
LSDDSRLAADQAEQQRHQLPNRSDNHQAPNPMVRASQQSVECSMNCRRLPLSELAVLA